ncbi:hypothetical protein LARV_01581, partial [Longilinea arvoryzae]
VLHFTETILHYSLEKIINYRKRFIWSGMAVFIVSTLLAILVIIINLGVK